MVVDGGDDGRSYLRTYIKYASLLLDLVRSLEKADVRVSPEPHIVRSGLTSLESSFICQFIAARFWNLAAGILL